MRRWFATYFGFNKRELNGVGVLAVLLLLLWGIPRILSVAHKPAADDLSAQIAEIDRFLATADNRPAPAADRARSDHQPTENAESITYFPFDPNGLPLDDWMRLGITERQARVIKNYEAKGGRFRKKEDLRKIYSIDSAGYARLEPYIEIKPEAEYPPPERLSPVHLTDSSRTAHSMVRQAATPPLHIELNGADTVELQYLPGIGPVFASRIVRYRELLGGFYDRSQLMDVYGFDSVRFAGLEGHVYVDTLNLRKIPLNTADYDRFRKHPFINHKLANAIVQYRKQHGPYRSLADLLDIVIMDELNFRKIAPYLTLAND